MTTQGGVAKQLLLTFVLLTGACGDAPPAPLRAVLPVARKHEAIESRYEFNGWKLEMEQKSQTVYYLVSSDYMRTNIGDRYAGDWK